MKKLLASCALAALATSSAFAQSTGTQTFENQEIVVTATKKDKGVTGVIVPETIKTREVFTAEHIQRETPRPVDQRDD